MSEESAEKRPFGNLSFEDYTFETSTEKLVAALQAVMKVQGYTTRSPGWRKLQRLKKALKKDKRYSFSLIPRERVERQKESPEEKEGPEHDLSPLLSEVTSHCLGVKLRKVSSRNSSAGYGVLTIICAGPLADLRIPPGPCDLVTVDRFKKEVEERCFAKDDRFNSIRILNVGVKQSRKKLNCMITVEAIYK